MRQRRRERGKRGSKRYALLAGLVVLIVVIVTASVYLGQSQPTGVEVGKEAPDFKVLLTNGTAANLTTFRGHPVLLWFVTTWCTSCQEGARLLSGQYYSQLRAKGVTIVTVELYNNLGQPGPSIEQFASQYGGATQAGWLYGTSNQDTTYKYDPQAYLDIYYAVDSQGVIVASGVELPNDLPKIVSSF